ncbi:16631_t:CDS:1, partial [Acaulospora morrowiae]
MRKRRKNEAPDQCKARTLRDRLNKRKRELKTDEQHEMRLVKDRERKQHKRSILKSIDKYQNHQEEVELELNSTTYPI